MTLVRVIRRPVRAAEVPFSQALGNAEPARAQDWDIGITVKLIGAEIHGRVNWLD